MRLPIEKKVSRSNHISYTVAYYAILGALAIVLSAMENLIVPWLSFLPPGAKPGLANIVVMTVACTGSITGTVYIVILKSLFVLLTRGGSAFVMSIAGGVISAAVITVMLRLKLPKVSVAGISVLGAVVHNICQLGVACVLTGAPAMGKYAPLLIIFGVVSGIITGAILSALLPKIRIIRNQYISEGK